MSDKHDSKKLKSSKKDSQAVPNGEAKDAQSDGKIKAAAGKAQEEQTPIRKSAGHANTH